MERRWWRWWACVLNDLIIKKTLLVAGVLGKTQCSFYWQSVREPLIQRKERSQEERKSLSGTKQHPPNNEKEWMQRQIYSG